ncbi:aminotransferase [Paenibacillus sp. SI8]|uniref:aminotransferase n=1 Tax=unclassified Paenibacillus TaxID=185978 RepID=UPI0034661DBA
MTNHRQTIGNGGNVPQVHTRSLTGAPQIGEFGQFPGIGGGFPQGGGFPVPFEGGGDFFGGGAGNAGGGFFGGGSAGGGGGFFGGGSGGGGVLGGLLGGGGGAGGGSNALSGLNMKQISGFVERMGGIDGIIGTMGKVQKFMSSFQQMAPMVKVLLGSFGKGKVKSSDIEAVLPSKRKRRKKSATSRRKTGKSASIKRKRR